MAYLETSISILFSSLQLDVTEHVSGSFVTLHQEKKFFACMEKTSLATIIASANVKHVRGMPKMVSVIVAMK